MVRPILEDVNNKCSGCHDAGGPEAMVVALALTVLATMVWRLPDDPPGYIRDVTSGIFVTLYVPFLAGFAALLLRDDDGAAGEELVLRDPALHRNVGRLGSERLRIVRAPDGCNDLDGKAGQVSPRPLRELGSHLHANDREAPLEQGAARLAGKSAKSCR